MLPGCTFVKHPDVENQCHFIWATTNSTADTILERHCLPFRKGVTTGHSGNKALGFFLSDWKSLNIITHMQRVGTN